MHYFLLCSFLLLNGLFAEEPAVQGFNRPLLTLTFDDGWSSAYEPVFPLLNRYGYQATFFIVTDVIGQERRLTRDNLVTMYKAGHEIGAHTKDHKNLTTLSLPQVEEELAVPKKLLEEWIAAPVPNFAAPYGAVSPDIINLVKKHYKSNRSVLNGFNSRSRLDPYSIKVHSIRSSVTPAQVEQWIATAIKLNLWLVLNYHQVDLQHGELSTTPADFEKHLEIIKNKKIQVVTIEQALKEVMSQ